MVVSAGAAAARPRRRRNRIRLTGSLRHFDVRTSATRRESHRAVRDEGSKTAMTIRGIRGPRGRSGSGATLLAADRAPACSAGGPGDGRTPEFPPPTIVDYKPRSTLKVAEHPVPRAKFPVIDIHSHQPTPITPEQFDTRRPGHGREQPARARQPERRLRRSAAAGPRRDCRRARTRTGWCCSPTSTSRASARRAGRRRPRRSSKADIKAGARGLKIFKDLGLRIRKADGSRLQGGRPRARSRLGRSARGSASRC